MIINYVSTHGYGGQTVFLLLVFGEKTLPFSSYNITFMYNIHIDQWESVWFFLPAHDVILPSMVMVPNRYLKVTGLVIKHVKVKLFQPAGVQRLSLVLKENTHGAKGHQSWSYNPYVTWISSASSTSEAHHPPQQKLYTQWYKCLYNQGGITRVSCPQGVTPLGPQRSKYKSSSTLHTRWTSDENLPNSHLQPHQSTTPPIHLQRDLARYVLVFLLSYRVQGL